MLASSVAGCRFGGGGGEEAPGSRAEWWGWERRQRTRGTRMERRQRTRGTRMERVLLFLGDLCVHLSVRSKLDALAAVERRLRWR